MSNNPGLRKGSNKPLQPSDTTGFPPTRIDDQRNSRRAQQITHLHQQFEDLKKKIKQVQNKNQKIIQKIHKAYNFKKKNAYTEEYIGGVEEGSPIVHYQNPYDQRASGQVALSVGARSNKSDRSQKQVSIPAMTKKVSEQPSQHHSQHQNRKGLKDQSKFNYSAQYVHNKNPNQIMQGQQLDYRPSYGTHSQARYPTTQMHMPPQYPPYPQQNPLVVSSAAILTTNQQIPSQNNLKMQRKFIEQLNQQKILLQTQLSQKQSQIYKLQALFKNNNRLVKGIIQTQLQQFYQNVLQKNLTAIQKAFKRYEQKLKNLKKISIIVKDRQQQKRSSRLLQQGKYRRSKSRSRKNTPPKQNIGGSRNLNQSRQIIRDSRDNISNINTSKQQRESRSRSRIISGTQQHQQQKSKKQFQQIANKYEQIIKTKIQQIQKLDKRYKLKQRECYQLKMRVDVLQKRLAQQQKRINSNNLSNSITSNSNILQPELTNKKKMTTQSDLLDQQSQHINQQFYQSQIASLQKKLQQFHTISNQKSTQISNLQNQLSTLQNKNKLLYNQYQDNLNKNKNKYTEQLQKYKKQADKLIYEKIQEINGYKNQLITVEKKYLEKECQFFSLESKIKKLENMGISKDRKIEELEKIVQNTCPTDRSMMSSSMISNTGLPPTTLSTNNNNNIEALKKLKQQIEHLQQKLQKNQNQIFTLTKKNTYYKTKNQQLQSTCTQLKKQLQIIHVQNQQLKINVNMNNISAVMKDHGNQENQNSRDQEDLMSNSLSAMDNQNNNSYNNNQKKGSMTNINLALNLPTPQDLQTLHQKIQQITKQKQQWYNKYQKSKNQSLQKQSENIKIKSQLNFIQKQKQDTQNTINRYKSQNQSYKLENKELEDRLQRLEQDMEIQREGYKEQISDLERKWVEFQTDLMKKSITMNILQGQRSQRSSVISHGYSGSKNQVDHLSTQNQLLTVKLKQAQAQIQTQRCMQQKIIEQYQTVMQDYKIQLKNKSQTIRSQKQQIQDLNNKIGNLNMRIQIANKNQSNLNTTSAAAIRKQQKNQLLQRIEQLQAELKQTKQINNKLTDMQGQLFDQIKIKEEERGELYEQIRKKQLKIQQLQQVIQVREQSNNNPLSYGSHVSQSTHKERRESLKSQSSLKYSSHSQALKKSRLLSSRNNASDERIFDLQLSQAGSQFYQQPSQISNISQFFQKQELPYQKIKIKRQEQIKLFQKTASYIKSLKKAIQEKNKRIKLLEKKIESLRSSQLVRKEIGLDIDIKQDRLLNINDRLQSDDTFRDYQSVQLQYRRGGHLRRYKQLEHDTKLVMQQNNLLIQNIESLQQQLLKAQQQENSLVKIKDLYKQQIKKLIKKNQEQTKAFQEQLKNQKKRVQESQSVHNIQAIKQLFIKIIQIVGLKFTQQNMSAKKKEQKRKQMEQYVKVMSNILKMDKKTKDTLLGSLQK